MKAKRFLRKLTSVVLVGTLFTGSFLGGSIFYQESQDVLASVFVSDGSGTVGEVTAIKGAQNLPTLDNTAETTYWYAGNAFYGMQRNGVEFGEAYDKNSWLLVDTDAMWNGQYLYSTWGNAYRKTEGEDDLYTRSDVRDDRDSKYSYYQKILTYGERLWQKYSSGDKSWFSAEEKGAVNTATVTTTNNSYRTFEDYVSGASKIGNYNYWVGAATSEDLNKDDGSYTISNVKKWYTSGDEDTTKYGELENPQAATTITNKVTEYIKDGETYNGISEKTLGIKSSNIYALLDAHLYSPSVTEYENNSSVYKKIVRNIYADYTSETTDTGAWGPTYGGWFSAGKSNQSNKNPAAHVWDRTRTNLWSRSFSGLRMYDSYLLAWLVDVYGNLGSNNYLTASQAVSPAFNLDTNRVVMARSAQEPAAPSSSLASYNPDNLAGEKVSSGEVVFTLETDKLGIDVNMPKTITNIVPGKTYTIPYTITRTTFVDTKADGEKRYISVAIYNENDEMEYYGQLKEVEASDTEGEAELTIPSDLDSNGNYRLAIFEEQISGSYNVPTPGGRTITTYATNYVSPMYISNFKAESLSASLKNTEQTLTEETTYSVDTIKDMITVNSSSLGELAKEQYEIKSVFSSEKEILSEDKTSITTLDNGSKSKKQIDIIIGYPEGDKDMVYNISISIPVVSSDFVNDGTYQNDQNPATDEDGFYTSKDGKWKYKTDAAGVITNLYTEKSISNSCIKTINGVNVLYIPEEIDGHTVSGIGGGTMGKTFAPDNSGFKEIVFPTSVTTINDYAFYNFSANIKLVVPSQVSRIGAKAFYKSGVTSLEINSDDLSIGYMAFADCKKIKKLILPSGVSLTEKSFSGCTGLQTLNVDLATLPNYSFDDCTSISKVIIGENVNKVEYSWNGQSSSTDRTFYVRSSETKQTAVFEFRNDEGTHYSAYGTSGNITVVYDKNAVCDYNADEILPDANGILSISTYVAHQCIEGGLTEKNYQSYIKGIQSTNGIDFRYDEYTSVDKVMEDDKVLSLAISAEYDGDLLAGNTIKKSRFQVYKTDRKTKLSEDEYFVVSSNSYNTIKDSAKDAFVAAEGELLNEKLETGTKKVTIVVFESDTNHAKTDLYLKIDAYSAERDFFENGYRYETIMEEINTISKAAIALQDELEAASASAIESKELYENANKQVKMYIEMYNDLLVAMKEGMDSPSFMDGDGYIEKSESEGTEKLTVWISDKDLEEKGTAYDCEKTKDEVTDQNGITHTVYKASGVTIDINSDGEKETADIEFWTDNQGVHIFTVNGEALSSTVVVSDNEYVEQKIKEAQRELSNQLSELKGTLSETQKNIDSLLKRFGFSDEEIADMKTDADKLNAISNRYETLIKEIDTISRGAISLKKELDTASAAAIENKDLYDNANAQLKKFIEKYNEVLVTMNENMSDSSVLYGSGYLDKTSNSDGTDSLTVWIGKEYPCKTTGKVVSGEDGSQPTYAANETDGYQLLYDSGEDSSTKYPVYSASDVQVDINSDGVKETVNIEFWVDSKGVHIISANGTALNPAVVVSDDEHIFYKLTCAQREIISRLSEVKGTLSETQKKIDALLKRFGFSDEEIVNMETDADKISALADRVTASQAALEAKIAENEDYIREYQSKVNAFYKALTSKDLTSNDVDDIVTDLNFLLKEINSLQDDNKKMVEELKKLGQEVEGYKGTIASQASIISSQAIDIEKLNENIKNLKNNIDSLNDTITKYDETIKQAGTNVDKLTEENGVLSGTITDLQSELSKATDISSAQVEKINDLSSKLSEANDKIEKGIIKEDELNTIIKNSAEEIKIIQSLNASQSGIITELSSKTNELETKNANQQKVIDDLNNNISDIIKQNDLLSNKLSNLNVLIGNQASEIKKLTETVNEQNGSITSLKEEIKVYKEILNSASVIFGSVENKNAEDIKKAVNDYVASKLEGDRVISMLQSKLGTTATGDELLSQVGNVEDTNTISKIQAKLGTTAKGDELVALCGEMKIVYVNSGSSSDSGSGSNSSSSNSGSGTVTITSSTTPTKTTSTTTPTTTPTQTTTQNSQITELQKKNTELESKNAELSSLNTALSNRVTSLASENENLNGSVNKLTDKNKTLRSTLIATTEQMYLVEAGLSEQDTKQNLTGSKLNSLQTSNSTLGQLCKDLQTEIDELSKKLSNAYDTIKTLQNTNASTQSSYSQPQSTYTPSYSTPLLTPAPTVTPTTTDSTETDTKKEKASGKSENETVSDDLPDVDPFKGTPTPTPTPTPVPTSTPFQNFVTPTPSPTDYVDARLLTGSSITGNAIDTVTTGGVQNDNPDNNPNVKKVRASNDDEPNFVAIAIVAVLALGAGGAVLFIMNPGLIKSFGKGKTRIKRK